MSATFQIVLEGRNPAQIHASYRARSHSYAKRLKKKKNKQYINVRVRFVDVQLRRLYIRQNVKKSILTKVLQALTTILFAF